MDIAVQERLAGWIAGVLGSSVEVVNVSRLKGGGIQENWTVDIRINGRPRAFVLRKDAPSTIDASHSRAHEFALVQAAYASGVTVPEPIGFCEDILVLGAPFALIEKVSGIGLGPKIVKELRDEDQPKLTQRLAQELARIHKVKPPQSALSFLGKPPMDFAQVEIALLRDWLDRLKLSRPGLEWALRWCELHTPKAFETTLIHRDFRTGNYMVDGGELTAVLDWEFACWGDPMFDIGWFMAECWRFSRPDLEAGGIGQRDAFYRAYEAESGRTVNDVAVRAYEVLSHCRWAIIALQQGERHTSGREPSLEHALTGKIAEELELMALRLTKPARWRLRYNASNTEL
jgi:aminoglycoside phosphotransferase (APT) family kinase protein